MIPNQSRRENSNDEPITAHPGSAVVKGGNISIKVDANALSIVALVFSIAALVAVFVQSNKDPQIVDAKIAAGMAEARAGMEQQVADAKAVAHAADTNSRVALDKVEQTQVQLGAKGLVQPSTH